jgi:hypothetical protein
MTVDEMIRLLFAASLHTNNGSNATLSKFDPVFSGRQRKDEGTEAMTKQTAKKQAPQQESTKTNMPLATRSSGTELENIAAAAEQDAGFEKILKFKKGEYLIGEEEIPLGTEYLAHVVGWTKCWIKFADGEVVERKVYRVARGEQPPEREDLDDLELIGKKDQDGMSADSWVYQYLLPLENRSKGELVIFVTPSFGGRRAVADLGQLYTRRRQKFGGGQPIIKLAKTDMPTKKFGKVPRPLFEVVGWDQEELSSNIINLPRDTIPPATSEDDFGDELPDLDDKIPY